MNCYKFLIPAILAIVSGVVLIIYSDKSKSEVRPYGNIGIKLSGGLILMFAILVLIGSLIGLSFGCQPQSLLQSST